MNEEIIKRLTNYVDSMEDLVAKGTDLASTEIPLYVQELLNWMCFDSFTSAICHFSIFLLFLLPAALIIWYIKKVGLEKIEKECEDCAVFVILIPIALSIIGLAPLSASINHVKSGVKTIIAPRVVLVEQIQKVIKENK